MSLRHPKGDANGRQRRQPSPTEPKRSEDAAVVCGKRGVPREHRNGIPRNLKPLGSQLVQRRTCFRLLPAPGLVGAVRINRRCRPSADNNGSRNS